MNDLMMFLELRKLGVGEFYGRFPNGFLQRKKKKTWFLARGYV